MIKDKNIFLTGGTGYFGLSLIKLLYADNTITVFSRDESRQAMLKMRFPKLRCIIGDVRDSERLIASAAGHDTGIFCASLKHVGIINQNIEEAAQIIVTGSINAKKAVLQNGFESACMISTDKSRQPATLYGAMKYIAGEQFIWDAEQYATRLSTCICGNIINSTGSVIPKIWESIIRGTEMVLYDTRMTRFTITGEKASELVVYCLGHSGFSVVPKLQSFLVVDLFQIYRERFGLKFCVSTQPVVSERLHEKLISSDDVERTSSRGDYFMIHYRDKQERPTLINNEYCSSDYVMEINGLEAMLKQNNYFMPPHFIDG